MTPQSPEAPATPTIAITGTGGFIGDMLLRHFVRQPHPPRLVAIDLKPPQITPKRFEFFPCDLTAPDADHKLATLFAKKRCDTVIHAALHSQPKRSEEYSHELQSIGSMYLLHAVHAAGVRQLIVSSTTDVYGAFPENPSFLTEDHPLRGGSLSAFLRDRIDVEQQCARFAKHHPEITVTVLRPCTILGPDIRNYKTHLLKQSVIPTVMGFDPLVQFVHEADVLQAFLLALEKRVGGAFNIVGDGVTPLSRALALMGKVQIPVAGPLLWAGTGLLWHLKIQKTPPTHIQFMQYPCIADGSRAKRELGFTPRYALRDVLQSFQERHANA